MSKKTPAIDQAFLILLGIGAAANFLIPACVMLRIEIDNSIMFWHGPAFFAGLAGWLIFPTLRSDRKNARQN